MIEKTATQLYSYNGESGDMYTRPALDAHYVNKHWNYLTQGMSEEEITDFSAARDKLNHYEKIYSLIEYTSQLHETITCLELRMMSNNPTIAMNIYRKSKANSRGALF